MAQIGYVEWQAYAESFAFFGNSLFGTMRRTPKVSFRKNFWSKFPTFGSDTVSDACAAMEACVAKMGSVEDPTAQIAAEYELLFVGSPKPAAAPYESLYRSEKGGEASIELASDSISSDEGPSQSALEMRELLHSAGLELKNVNNQPEDHMGIELLFLSVLCTRIAQGDVPDAVPAEPEDVLHFIEAHPLAWVDAFGEAVAAAAPGGYFDCMLGITSALLKTLHTELTS
ncbi:MAG: molecular chaperone TorD family protein [Eggerthellaceae bacterium]|nr:molecular chaperone TorD family protein [Eggerthellaceae bacterium]